MPETINITGLNKAEVLSALYNASKQQGMGFLHARGAEPMSVEQAGEELKAYGRERPYFDYLHGRVMKVEIVDEINPWGYDRDNGQGACARALEPLFEAHAKKVVKQAAVPA